MGKRVVATKEPVAKKPKVEASAAEPEAPLLDALAAVNSIPKPCRELLQTALPFCLATPAAERHKFQLEMLDRITTMFDNIEEQKRATLNEAETQVLAIQAEKDAAVADLETKKATALSKQSDCEEKSKAVNVAKEAVAQAKEAACIAEKQAEELAAKKATLIATQESFQVLLKEEWQTLKDVTYTGHSWQKRNKAISEFLKKCCEQAQMEGSLVDAVEAALKIKPEQRSNFALLALDHAEACFKTHMDGAAQHISSLAEEESSHQAAIDSARAALSEKEAQQKDAETAWDAEQTQWVDLENAKEGAANLLKSVENKLEDENNLVGHLADELKSFLQIPALLSELKSPTSTDQEISETAQVASTEVVEPLAAPEAAEPVEPVEPGPVPVEAA